MGDEPEDNEFLTPSAAHNSAWRRGTDHDEMAVACRDVFEREAKSKQWPKGYGQNLRTYRFIGAWCEELLMTDKGRGFFADLWVRWSAEEKEHERSITVSVFDLYGVYEIKPKIHSAGALMRQIAMQNERMGAWKKAMAYDRQKLIEFFVQPIVMHDDPLIELYLRMSQSTVLLWDGKTLTPRNLRQPPMKIVSENP